jgi:hypothetical protein
VDLSSDRSQDEARIMERQLYRPGQTPAAPKTSVSKTPAPTPARGPAKPSVPSVKRSSATSASPSKGKRILLAVLLCGFGYYLLYGTPTQRRRVLIGLGMTLWLLMLGGVSYCLCLPDLTDVAREQRAIWEDPNLSFEEKRAKAREIDANLTDGERRQVREIGMKERMKEGNAKMFTFLKMSPEEQVAYLKKRDEENKQRRQQWASRQGGGAGGGGAGGGGAGGGGAIGGGRAGGGGGANGGGRAGGAGGANGGGRPVAGGPGAGGPGAGTPVAGGPGAGGPGGGRGNPGQWQKNFLDFTSPESRAGMQYQRGLSQQMGLGGGGFGGGGPPMRR